MELLTETNKTEKNISMLCGYNSSKQFIAMFVKKVGMTPIQYRKTKLINSDSYENQY